MSRIMELKDGMTVEKLKRIIEEEVRGIINITPMDKNKCDCIRTSNMLKENMKAILKAYQKNPEEALPKNTILWGDHIVVDTLNKIMSDARNSIKERVTIEDVPNSPSDDIKDDIFDLQNGIKELKINIQKIVISHLNADIIAGLSSPEIIYRKMEDEVSKLMKSTPISNITKNMLIDSGWVEAVLSHTIKEFVNSKMK